MKPKVFFPDRRYYRAMGLSIALILLAAMFWWSIPAASVLLAEVMDSALAVAIVVVAHLALLYVALAPMRLAWLWAWLIAVAFGAVDEWHQSFTPGRTTELIDWLFDALGAAAAVWLVDLAAAGRGSWPSLPRLLAPLPLAALASVTLAAVLVLLSPRPSAGGVALRVAQAAERLVPERVERRTLALAHEALETAREARAELRQRLSSRLPS